MRVVIIGLGICGKALASALQQQHRVCGISRQMRNLHGVPQVQGDATDQTVLAAAEAELGGPAETVVLCAGPGLRSGNDNMIDVIASNITRRWPDAWLAYTGSTAVYANADGSTIDEHGQLAKHDRAERLRQIETAVERQAQHLILRVGALVGPQRHFLRERLRQSPCRVRGPLQRQFPFCHDDDLVAVLLQAIPNQTTGLFNCTAPMQLRAQEYYDQLARTDGGAPPNCEIYGPPQPDRAIDSKKLRCVLPHIDWHDPLGRPITDCTVCHHDLSSSGQTSAATMCDSGGGSMPTTTDIDTRVADDKGHADHTKSATKRSLPGSMRRPITVTMLGAGSGFTPRVVNDILRIEGNQGGTINLVDIDVSRLDTMAKLIAKVIDQLGGSDHWSVCASTDRGEVLVGTDYIVNCIEVSGTACVRFDNDIPTKYGVDQCIGDTIGPGGLFKGLRTIPVWLEVLADCERLCPEAIILNYTNPMSMMCLAAAKQSSMTVLGMCHSVQGTSNRLATLAGVPYDELEWHCAGINHLAWMTKLVHKGQDLYPKLRARFENEVYGKHGEIEDSDLVRKDMMLHFGAFITESSGHLSEYLPYYRTSQEHIDFFCRARYSGQSSFYADEWPGWRAKADEERLAMLRGEMPCEWDRSWEYASWIIEGIEKDSPFRFHGNVPNNWRGGGPAIANLPHDGIVEVHCTADAHGIHPGIVGRLPVPMAGICASHMYYYEQGAMAAIERSKEAAIQALLLDPLTAACCTPRQIRDMTLEMFETEADYLPGFH